MFARSPTRGCNALIDNDADYGINATGTTQDTAYQLTAFDNHVTVSEVGANCVKLPLASAFLGKRPVWITIDPAVTTGTLIYPSSGDKLGGAAGTALSANSGFTLAKGFTVICRAVSSTQWQISFLLGLANNSGQAYLPTTIAGNGAVFSGSVSINSASYFSLIVNSLTAAGTTQSDATSMTGGECHFTTVAAGTGGRLPAAPSTGTVMTVYNRGANAVLVYPPSSLSAQINSLGANNAYSLPAGEQVTFKWFSTSTNSQIYTINRGTIGA